MVYLSGSEQIRLSKEFGRLTRLQHRNIVGFHLGPGGKQDGVDVYLKELDAAGVPFSIKNVNEFGALLDLACQLKNKSSIPHEIIWRYDPELQPYKILKSHAITNQQLRRSTNTDVPPNMPNATAAAEAHWVRVKSNMPQELPGVKDLVAIEVCISSSFD